MTSQPVWFRELESAGKGPDWIFSASFAPENGQQLGELFRALLPHGFTSYRAQQRQCSIHSRSCDYDLYIDDHQAETITALLEDRLQQNVYIFHTIQLCGNELQLVRGYGGYPGQHGDEETRCIHTLAQVPTLTDWSISYGGDAYPFETWRQGMGSTELLKFLGG